MGFTRLSRSPGIPVGSYPAISPLPSRVRSEEVRGKTLRGSTCHPSLVTSERRYLFCGTFLLVAETGRYPASCPMELGLSSRQAKGLTSDHLIHFHSVTKKFGVRSNEFGVKTFVSELRTHYSEQNKIQNPLIRLSLNYFPDGLIGHPVRFPVLLSGNMNYIILRKFQQKILNLMEEDRQPWILDPVKSI
jgi:hypothetical protein